MAHSNLADLLDEAAAAAPDRVAVVDAGSGRRVTWAELRSEAVEVATGLAGSGLVAGHRIVLSLGNRFEFVTTYLGALRAGLVVVPVNPRAATGELVRMLADCGARLVVADPTTATSVRGAVAGLADALDGADPDLSRGAVVPRIVVVGLPAVPGETTYDSLRAQEGTLAPPRTDTEALAVLLYTSGTSGKPRGAMLSHRALMANIEQAAQVEPPMITSDDVVLGVLPLFHVYGLNAVLGQVLRQRARVVLLDGFDPEDALTVIEDEAVSVLPVAPPVFAYWRGTEGLRDRLSSMRLVLSGSAPLSADVMAEFEEDTGVTVHQGYGLTEAAPVVTSTLCSRAVKRGSVGAALPGIAIRLVDEIGGVPEGEDPGEIAIRGDNLFSGYWPDGADGPDHEGWWQTGDVGFLDGDGDLFLVDRLKELVIVSGFNVYPSEVEDVLVEVDGVAEAAVIGVADELTGEAVVAYLRLEPGAHDDAVRRAAEAHAAVRLARFKQPTTWHVVDELPHTGTGKVAKGRLRAVERRRTLGLLE